MTNSEQNISFSAKLLQPDLPGKRVSWNFILLPKSASAKLPSRSMVSVSGTINTVPFAVTLEPDGQKSHWFKVEKKLVIKAGLELGKSIKIEMAPVDVEPEPKIPNDLKKALSSAPKAKAIWKEITATARRDWIQWIESAKRDATRVRRVENTCSMLSEGKRKVCCFDRSGIFSKGLSAPKAMK